MIRREMINGALGYRGAPVGDLGTGHEAPTRKALEQVATALLGRDALTNQVIAQTLSRVGIAQLASKRTDGAVYPDGIRC